jgi:hypothetical protein
MQYSASINQPTKMTETIQLAIAAIVVIAMALIWNKHGF